MATKTGSANNEVKSVAIVKHSTLQFSPAFSMLQQNTNLNVPPSNWLRKTTMVEQNIQDFTWHRGETYSSSIQMAGNSLDLTGEVDVISNAKNIKKLLKIPFSRSHISMMVHRIGKSLLLDEFDIHKHLLRQQQDDWKWLREFYYDYVARDMQMKCVPRKDKSRHKQQKKNMYSKFLYHSIADSYSESLDKDYHVTQAYQKLEDKDLKLLSENQPESDESDFHREILWTFEDIRMLIGTDLPIFGGNNYPCISLRLRDMRTPINVLTGLDYWLDNLMCNVPEVAMCFHLNGIVQRYELIKTEEIPNLKDSEFDPKEVTEIARNILSFLKANSTKEGHTYWLYKGVDDDVVKLYDLTALCGENMDERDSNPFTVPLGMLLYRVARNMRQRHKRKKVATIRTLLENCLLLLDEDTHPQVCTSSYYLLSDVYVPDSAVRDVWSDGDVTGSDEELNEADETEIEKDTSPSMTLDVKGLSRDDQTYRKTCQHITRIRPITGSTSQRSTSAVQCISKGLKCLDRDFTHQIHKSKNKVEEQARCNSSEAIPLPFEPLQKSAPPHNEREPPLHDDTEHLQLAETESATWHRLSKVLLLRKAAMAFYSLSKSTISEQKVGCTMRYIKSALRCFAGIRVLLPDKAEENRELLMRIISLAADVMLMFSHTGQKWADVHADMIDFSEEEMAILDSVARELDMFEYSWACNMKGNKEDLLLRCSQCYEACLALSIALHVPEQDYHLSLQKRYGNVKNELGVLYMNQAQQILQSKGVGVVEQINTLCEKSERTIDEGIAMFNSISDLANQALLYSNKGRLYRLQAQVQTQTSIQAQVQTQTSLRAQAPPSLPQNAPVFSHRERECYSKAIDCYQTALHILRTKNKFPEIWESVCWEMSTTYFNMAVLMQDYTPVECEPRQQVEKEVIDLMNKSLKYCDVMNSSPRQLMYQYRAGSVNHRLASLYHNTFRSETSEQRKKYLRQLTETHYRKAAQQFSSVDCSVELLRVQLELFALYEFCLAAQTNIKSRLRTLTLCVQCLVDCADVLDLWLQQLMDTDVEEKLKTEGERLADILDSRIQFTLLQLVKAFNSTKKRKNEQEVLKSLYARSLKKDWEGSEREHEIKQCGDTLTGKGRHLIFVLSKLKQFYQDVLLHEPG